MIDKTIYKYERESNKITISTEKPDKEYTILHRLIADEGMILFKNDIEVPCVDTYDITGWQEKEYIIEKNEKEI